jgi:16S rRNA (uracil1498-N3)-methyltransferase
LNFQYRITAMSNLRFYSAENLKIGATVKLSDNAANHATRVMRLNVGDKLFLFDGSGADFECELVSVQKSATLAKVLNAVKVNNESPLNITLLLGISAGDRMDIGMQKAVELGVNRIIPIKTERSVVKLDEEKAKKRLQHWQNVVIAACEQSGRAVLPIVEMPVTLGQFCAKPAGENTLRLTLDPLADKKLADLAKPMAEIQLLVGAEGGLGANEIGLAAAQGFIGVQLGKRILRTETAPLAAIATMQTLWGDF